MSAETWKLICDKKTWRTHLWKSKQLQQRTILQVCFQSLRDHRNWDDHANTWDQLTPLLQQQDWLIAQAMQQHRQICRRVVSALRKDDATFFSGIAAEVGQFVHPHQANNLWQRVRYSLPKFRQRRMQTPPEQMEDLEDQWHPYFQRLETGCTATVADLLQACHTSQLANCNVQTVCDLHELPTLQQIEDVFRQTQKGKSTGLDPIASGLFHAFPAETARIFFDLILKVYLWQAEPLA